MEPDIRFFQATATVIPTLLVAIVFTAKLADFDHVEDQSKPDDERAERRWHRKWTAAWNVLGVLTVLTVLGEITSLHSLLYNQPTLTNARLVHLAIYAELTLLAVGIFRGLIIAQWKRDKGKLLERVAPPVIVVIFILVLRIIL